MEKGPELKFKREMADTVENKPEEQPLKISIGTASGDIFIMFNRPMSGLRFTKTEAREFVRRISKETFK